MIYDRDSRTHATGGKKLLSPSTREKRSANFPKTELTERASRDFVASPLGSLLSQFITQCTTNNFSSSFPDVRSVKYR